MPRRDPQSTPPPVLPTLPDVTRITLLTDFGMRDGYVAAMKAVIADLAPTAIIDDVAHDIPPGDVEAAAWALSRYWRLYPPETVHVAVVDPSVGTDRRALAARADGRLLIAPDNGLLTRVFDEVTPSSVVMIENPVYLRHHVSRTFHGRDIFAPAAGHLARGLAVAELGKAVLDPVLLELARPERTGGGALGAVVHVDHFGNLISNIPADWLEGWEQVRLDGKEIGPVLGTYEDAEPGELLALVGSADLLEIAVRGGSAAERLGAGRGAEVVVEASWDRFVRD